MWTQSGVKSQKIEYLSRFFLYITETLCGYYTHHKVPWYVHCDISIAKKWLPGVCAVFVFSTWRVRRILWTFTDCISRYRWNDSATLCEAYINNFAFLCTSVFLRFEGLSDGNQKLKMEMAQSAATLESFKSADENQYEFCPLEARCFVFVFVLVFVLT